MFGILLSAALAPLAGAPDAKEPPVKKELFAKEDWYKNAEGKEREFVGVLKYKPRAKDVVGFNRFNAFTLEMGGKDGTRELYVAGSEETLFTFAGEVQPPATGFETYHVSILALPVP